MLTLKLQEQVLSQEGRPLMNGIHALIKDVSEHSYAL